MSATEARRAMRESINWTALTANTTDGYYRADRRLNRLTILDKERDVVLWQTSAYAWAAVAFVWIVSSYTEGAWSLIPVVLGVAAIVLSGIYRRRHFREIDRRIDKVLLRGWEDR